MRVLFRVGQFITQWKSNITEGLQIPSAFVFSIKISSFYVLIEKRIKAC